MYFRLRRYVGVSTSAAIVSFLHHTLNVSKSGLCMSAIKKMRALITKFETITNIKKTGYHSQKTLPFIRCDIKGLLSLDLLQHQHAIIAHTFCQYRNRVNETLRRKSRAFIKQRKIIPQPDNARKHSSNKDRSFIRILHTHQI